MFSKLDMLKNSTTYRKPVWRTVWSTVFFAFYEWHTSYQIISYISYYFVLSLIIFCNFILLFDVLFVYLWFNVQFILSSLAFFNFFLFTILQIVSLSYLRIRVLNKTCGVEKYIWTIEISLRQIYFSERSKYIYQE